MFSSKSYHQSEDAANNLLSKCKVKVAPVDVFTIANSMGLEVIEYNFTEDTSGVLVIENGKGTIGYNPKDARTRQRFTVAHELGHYVLHKKVNDLFVDNYFLMKFRNNNSYTQLEYRQEQQANSFAAALLMPEEFLKKEISELSKTDISESDLLIALSEKFDVSLAAMSYRLANLNIFFQSDS